MPVVVGGRVSEKINVRFLNEDNVPFADAGTVEKGGLSDHRVVEILLPYA
jgi:hypothetical protein